MTGSEVLSVKTGPGCRNPHPAQGNTGKCAFPPPAHPPCHPPLRIIEAQDDVIKAQDKIIQSKDYWRWACEEEYWKWKSLTDKDFPQPAGGLEG